MKDLPADTLLFRPASRPSLRPDSWSRSGCVLLLLAMPLCARTAIQHVPHSSSASPSVAAAKGAPSTITSFRLIQEQAGQAVEILSTKPLVPSIQAITSPDRVVIDLPNARIEAHSKRIAVQANQITALRADQFRVDPPVARIVVDLLSPRAATWDASGNRLVIHLGQSSVGADSPFVAPTVVSATSTSAPPVIAVRASGPVEISSEQGIGGNSFTAGADTTILHLSSGGEVHVCPGTTLGVIPSRTQHNLLLSMGSGGMETHFALDDSADTVMTPDFRIVFSGPGEFHYAVSANSRGDTCVRTLPGNNSPAVISELLGDRVFQVKPSDQLVFRSGQLEHVDTAGPADCGCPTRREPTLRAAHHGPMPPAPTPPAPMPSRLEQPSAAAQSTETVAKAAVQSVADAISSNRPAASPQNAEVHVQLEAPLVFHASGPPPTKPEETNIQIFNPPPGQTATVTVPSQAALNGNETPDSSSDSASAKQNHKGFFKRVGGMLSAIFH